MKTHRTLNELIALTLSWKKSCISGGFFIVVFALIFSFFFTSSTQAQDWNGRTDTLWGTAGNWIGLAPISSGSLALNFDTAKLTGAGNLTTHNDLTNFTASAMTFSNTLGENGFTLTGNQIILGGNITIAGTAGNPGPLIELDMTLNANRTVIIDTGISAEITGVINGAYALSTDKTSTGTLRLSGNNTFSGGLTVSGGTVVLAHNNAAGSGSIEVNWTNAELALANGVTINNAITMSNLGSIKSLGLEAGATSATIGGDLILNETPTETLVRVLTGETLTISGDISGTGFASLGAGTLVFSGSNVLNPTGAKFDILSTTLQLDYSTGNSPKLENARLGLGGATLELKGGSYDEVARAKFALFAGASRIIRVSGTSTLGFTEGMDLYAGSTVDFGEASLVTLTQSSNFGTTPKGWATLNGTDWAVTAGTGANQAVVAYTAYDHLADGGTIVNSTSRYYLLEGGTVTLAAASTGTGAILLKNDANMLIDPNGQTLKTTGIMIAKTGGDLTVGETVGDGILTRNGQLTLLNYSAISTLLVNSTITDDEEKTLTFTKSGNGLVKLAANNIYSGATFANEGILLISGTHSGNGIYEVRGELAVEGIIGTGAVTVYDGGLVSGGGTINGATTLQAGAALSAGFVEAIDTLTFTNGLDISATAGMTDVFAFTLGSSQAVSDLIDVTDGILNIGTRLLDFNTFTFTVNGSLAEQDYILFQSTALSGSLAWNNLSGNLGGGYAGTLSLLGNNVILTVVPEPSAILLMLFAGSFLIIRRFRIRR